MATRTLSDLRAEVRDDLAESTARLWTDAALNRWLNEGQLDMARRAEILQTRSNVTTLSSVGEYSAPVDMLRAHRVEWTPSGSNQPVYPLEMRQVNAMDAIWWTQQKITQSVPEYLTIFGSPQKLILYPIPSQNGTLTVWYYRVPANMVADGDLPDLPTGWDDCLVHFAVYRALVKDRDPRWAEARDRYRDLLETLIDMTRQWHDQPDFFTPSAGPFGASGSFYRGW